MLWLILIITPIQGPANASDYYIKRNAAVLKMLNAYVCYTKDISRPKSTSDEDDKCNNSL